MKDLLFDESIGSVIFCKSMDGFGVEKRRWCGAGCTLVLASKKMAFSSFGRGILFAVFLSARKEFGKNLCDVIFCFAEIS
ncbi:hypothetical protein [Clostridium minihomine]|uniref:hypothetical protein n=1 Tax=Clostridium minihomine TaxID=2045012 RepID=UPI00101AE256|nr:hypothetical protein [Clostridium minihomine]